MKNFIIYFGGFVLITYVLIYLGSGMGINEKALRWLVITFLAIVFAIPIYMDPTFRKLSLIPILGLSTLGLMIGMTIYHLN